MSGKREVRIDIIKDVACILVVLGHFFQSMVKARILPETHLYNWFNTTIYYFHVPLFFICSGYLYQQHSGVTDFQSWIKNVRKKALILGLPYFVFSTVLWVLKSFFANSVNNEIGGLWYTLFAHPASPYWFLYILFFIFLITPNTRNLKSTIVIVAFSLLLKLLRIYEGSSKIMEVYAVQGVCANMIFFVLGMLISRVGWENLTHKTVGSVTGFLFISLSLFTYKISNGFVAFGMGLLACTSVIMITGNKGIRWLNWITEYQFPVFLMHTMFAAPVRILLTKVGINNALVQVVSGILISFAGPIVAMVIMEKLRIDFLVYPKKLCKKGIRTPLT